MPFGSSAPPLHACPTHFPSPPFTHPSTLCVSRVQIHHSISDATGRVAAGSLRVWRRTGASHPARRTAWRCWTARHDLYRAGFFTAATAATAI